MGDSIAISKRNPPEYLSDIDPSYPAIGTFAPLAFYRPFELKISGLQIPSNSPKPLPTDKVFGNRARAYPLNRAFPCGFCP